MGFQSPFALFSFLFQILFFATSVHSRKCKAIPGTEDWPTISEWSALNQSLSGRLIMTVPPGAVCHPGQPSYNVATCATVTAGWGTYLWHSGDPVSVIGDTWTNDTCLPYPTYPCSGEGYPLYVVNATCPEDVKKGINFGRRHNIRLVVKGTGHDYHGRSVAPNSLSIWTHHMRGLSVQSGFKPKGCRSSINGAAITVAAGMQMLEIDQFAALQNLTIVSGGSPSVGVGGYLTGGGHGALSSTYGMAADQVLEIEVVSPNGNLITANECMNEDIFWAMRGGGGSTFGIMTSVTFQAYPSSPFAVVDCTAVTLAGGEPFWIVMASVLSKFPYLDSLGISAYTLINRNLTYPTLPFNIDVFSGRFMLPLLSPSNTTLSLTTTVLDVLNNAVAPYPLQFNVSATPQIYGSFWDWYNSTQDVIGGGGDYSLGSRLLDGKALTQNLTALKDALQTATPHNAPLQALFVGGRGVQNAKPRGGSNAVNPAWRRAYVHAISIVGWAPFDLAGKMEQQSILTNIYVAALHKLAPDMGAYVNEADPNEPNFQESFWGSNYPRLLEIKRAVDPDDVLWCRVCVGNEKWQIVGDRLCQI